MKPKLYAFLIKNKKTGEKLYTRHKNTHNILVVSGKENAEKVAKLSKKRLMQKGHGHMDVKVVEWRK